MPRHRGARAAIALLAGLPLLATAAFGAGWLLLALLGLDGEPLRWDTWLRYARVLDLPAMAPHAWKVRLSGAVTGIAALAAWLPVLAIAAWPQRRGLHGDARFATAADARRHGLLSDAGDGIVVGRLGRRLLRLRGQQFVLVAAPTRSGKGVGIVVPNLLAYTESVVVLDIKQENFALTSGWRAAQGQDVFLFNPFATDRRTHRWNPLGYVSPDPAFRISDLQAIAALLYPDADPAQRFWTAQARNAFMAFALLLFERFDQERDTGWPAPLLNFPTLGRVYRLSTGDGGPARGWLSRLAAQAGLSDATRAAFATLLGQADETFASILGSFQAPLHAWINPVLDAATSANDFSLADLRRRRMTVYVGIQPDRLGEARLLLNLFFSQAIHANTRTLPQADPSLRHACLLLMDEFTSIGKLDILVDAVAYMAGYNLRLLPVVQSVAQLDATYGAEAARTLMTNHALQVVFAPREQRDAVEWSAMLGDTTVRRRSVTRRRWRLLPNREGDSLSVSDERRPLMLPQELKAMPAGTQLVLFEGMPHPLKCGKVRYYADPVLRRRLLPPVQVPVITVGDAADPERPAAR